MYRRPKLISKATLGRGSLRNAKTQAKKDHPLKHLKGWFFITTFSDVSNGRYQPPLNPKLRVKRSDGRLCYAGIFRLAQSQSRR